MASILPVTTASALASDKGKKRKRSEELADATTEKPEKKVKVVDGSAVHTAVKEMKAKKAVPTEVSEEISMDAAMDSTMYATEDSADLPANTIKIVEGIAIPVPEPIIREKKKKEPAKVVRERRKREREEKAHLNALENRKKAIADGTFDFKADEIRKKERQIDKFVKAEIQRRENASEFGPKLPHPSILLKFEKEIEKELKKQKLLGDLDAERRMMHEKLIVCPTISCFSARI